MEMRLIKHALWRGDNDREVPQGADGRSENRQRVLKRFTARCSSGLTTIKSLTDRITAVRAEPKETASDRENPPQNATSDAELDDHPATDSPETCLNLSGHLVQHDSAPDNRWTAYSKKYREEHSKKLCERRLEATGINEYRFELIEIDRAWWRMKVGEIPGAATHVWEVLDTALPVHLIAEDVQISVRECVFWLTVFKRHLDVREEVQSERCVYFREEGPADLSTAIADKVRALH